MNLANVNPMDHRAYNPLQLRSDSDGFTLLEVLVSLILVSLVTIAILQSFLSMSNLSDRAQRATEIIHTQYVDSVLLERVIEGLFPEPAIDGRYKFQGSASQFSGMSSGFIPLGSRKRGVVFIEVTAADDGIMLSVDKEERVIAQGEGVRGFSYLGTDREWHLNWPPDNALPFGPPDKIKTQDHELTLSPVMPLAIRVHFLSGTDWIAIPRGPVRVSPSDDNI